MKSTTLKSVTRVAALLTFAACSSTSLAGDSATTTYDDTAYVDDTIWRTATVRNVAADGVQVSNSSPQTLQVAWGEGGTVVTLGPGESLGFACTHDAATPVRVATSGGDVFAGALPCGSTTRIQRED